MISLEKAREFKDEIIKQLIKNGASKEKAGHIYELMLYRDKVIPCDDINEKIDELAKELWILICKE